MKRFTLWLIRQFSNNREFRIDVCKELHRNAQNYFGEQTGYGRYYEACGEFFEAAPGFTQQSICRGGVIEEFDNVCSRLKILPQKELERISAQFYGKEYTNATPEKKKEYDYNYRKVEAESNRQIELAGGVEAWYLSGQGRLMEFGTSDSNGS